MQGSFLTVHHKQIKESDQSGQFGGKNQESGFDYFVAGSRNFELKGVGESQAVSDTLTGFQEF